MAKGDPIHADQRSRVDCSAIGSQTVTGPHKVQVPPDQSRQHDGSGLHKEEREHCKSRTYQDLRKDLGMGGPQQYSISGPAHSRDPEFSRRSSIQTGSRSKRLEIGPISVFKHSTVKGSNNSGLICKFRQLPSAKVFLVETPARSRESQCLAAPLARKGSICIPPILPYSPSVAKDSLGRDSSNSDNTSLAHSNLVSQTTINVGCSSSVTSKQRFVDKSCRGSLQDSKRPENQTSRLDIVRQRLTKSGVPRRAADIIADGHRATTNASYASAFRRFSSWCVKREINPLSPTLNTIIEFLTDTFDEGLKVSSLGVIRSSLSDTFGLFDGFKVGQHPTILSLLESMANLRPALFKETPQWNVDSVLINIQSWGDNASMEMDKLTMKLSMLFALASGARCNELANLKSSLVFRTKDGIRFKLDKHKKQRRSSVYPGYLDIPSFPDNKVMCPVACFDWYSVRTAGYSSLEGDDFLFRALTHPHGKVTSATISRWLSKCILDAGFDLKNTNAGHSVRGASATKAKNLGLSTRDIMRAVEWNTDSVFYNHYCNSEFNPSFGRTVLQTRD